MRPFQDPQARWKSLCRWFLSANVSVWVFHLLLSRFGFENELLSKKADFFLLLPLAAWIWLDHLEDRPVPKPFLAALFLAQIPFFFVYHSLLGVASVSGVIGNSHGSLVLVIAAPLWLCFACLELVNFVFRTLFNVRFELTLALLPFFMEFAFMIKDYVYP